MHSFRQLLLFSLTVLGFLQYGYGLHEDTTGRITHPYTSPECLGKSDPGSCSLEDNNCLCAFKPFVEGTFACFKTSCSDSGDLRSAYDMATAMCTQAGVTETIVAPPKRTLIPAGRAYPVAVGWA
ncbi:hypothetical protein B0J17DRAFT_737106 [Rhizoctonia solani]|nr:hypothetical protein B0J17DRAFT_737106 [Rhizoctonia solani]